MKKIITGIIVLYAPIGLCLNSSLLQDNLYRINIATLEGEEVPPVNSEDREGEDDPGILKDAQSGNSLAQFAYGMVQFQKGNYPDAAAWWDKAANQGHQNAQFELGKLYVQGKGVPQNNVKAYTLFMLSADQGFDKAQSAKKDLEKNLSKSEKEDAMKMYRHYTGAKH